MREKKILVVDFDEESLISISNLVFEEGFQAVTAMDGLSGYEKYKAEDFDLVIVEPMLPKLHGFELMKRIKQDTGRNTPIIVVTGIYREPSCKMEALQVYGASGFFTKPWNKDDLRAKMLQLLVNGHDEKAEKQETAPPPPPAKAPASAEGEDWGLLRKETASRETKTARSLDDIEKELQAAVSGLAGTARKKETPKPAVKAKKETKAGVEGDVEALLKGAIGGLGLDEKRPRQEPQKPMARPTPPPPKQAAEPTPKPAPQPEPEGRISPAAKEAESLAAKEIKDRIPPPPRRENISTPAPPRVRPESPRPPRGIDQTLIAIDKIPLDTAKDAPESEKPAIHEDAPEAEEKRAYFDSYGEPAKKRPPAALIGSLAAAILIVSGTTFIIFKSKRPKEPARQMVSSLQPTLPNEFAERQKEIPADPVNREAEPPSATKPETKAAVNKEAARTVDQPQAAEVTVPIAPVLPEETQAHGLELQLDQGTNSSAPGSQAETPQTKAPGQQTVLNTTAATPPAKPQAKEPTRVLAKPGDLVDLADTDVQPVLLKKVNPIYPVQALNMGLGGTVTVNALVSERGDVLRTEILKGVKGGSGLEKAAETAIRQWQFKPAEKDGVPVRVWKPLDIVFKPNPTSNQ